MGVYLPTLMYYLNKSAPLLGRPSFNFYILFDNNNLLNIILQLWTGKVDDLQDQKKVDELN